MKLRTLVMLVLTGAVVLTISSYQLISNSLRDDNQAETDLGTLSSKVNSYFSSKSKLPDKLEELQVGSRLQTRLDRYDYNKKSTSKYELCATFKRPGQSTDTDYGEEIDGASSTTSRTSLLSSYSNSKTISSQVKSHATGKQCFEEDADRYGTLNSKSSSSLYSTHGTTDAPDGSQIEY